jgi:hypothetical protein
VTVRSRDLQSLILFPLRDFLAMTRLPSMVLVKQNRNEKKKKGVANPFSIKKRSGCRPLLLPGFSANQYFTPQP